MCWRPFQFHEYLESSRKKQADDSEVPYEGLKRKKRISSKTQILINLGIETKKKFGCTIFLFENCVWDRVTCPFCGPSSNQVNLCIQRSLNREISFVSSSRKIRRRPTHRSLAQLSFFFSDKRLFPRKLGIAKFLGRFGRRSQVVFCRGIEALT